VELWSQHRERRDTIREWLGDLLWMAAAFITMSIVGYYLRQQGVDVPTLPDWVTGL
jgi:hydrogenase/urease accessory protein HupE